MNADLDAMDGGALTHVRTVTGVEHVDIRPARLELGPPTLGDQGTLHHLGRYITLCVRVVSLSGKLLLNSHKAVQSVVALMKGRAS